MTMQKMKIVAGWYEILHEKVFSLGNKELVRGTVVYLDDTSVLRISGECTYRSWVPVGVLKLLSSEISEHFPGCRVWDGNERLEVGMEVRFKVFKDIPYKIEFLTSDDKALIVTCEGGFCLVRITSLKPRESQLNQFKERVRHEFRLGGNREALVETCFNVMKSMQKVGAI